MFALLIILVLIGLVVLGVRMMATAGLWEDGKELAGMILIFVGGIGALILTVTLIVNHSTSNSTIAQYESIKNTIDQSRKSEISEIERAALTQKIMEVNQEIASYKYWNATVLGDFIPDKLAELEELK